MHWLNALTAASVGVALATVGAFIVPADPAREQLDGSLLRSALVLAAACAWALWRDELAGTLLPFAVASLLLGARRAGAAVPAVEG